ncbi:MAG: nuclear transport factor 2 family protein, partial [Pseudomonadales bacterium]
MTSSNERELIKAVIQVYFDSMYESDPSKVHEVFHPNAKIT